MSKPSFVSQKTIILLVIACLFFCGFFDVRLADVETAIIEEDYLKAEKSAQEFLSQNPQGRELQQARYYLGVSRLYLAKYDEARKAFTLLLDSAPEPKFFDKAHLGIIDSYLLEGDYTQALERANKLLQTSPQSELLSLIYLKIARANLKLTHWTEARKYLQKIVRDFPQSVEAHLAKRLLEEKQYFTVQVGAFLERGRAENLTQELLSQGKYAYIVETIDLGQRKFYRVRVGQLSRLEEARDQEQGLSQLGYPTRIYP
jgi:tetratricopeptide (TPR) repeat protein